jgi:hypothetical protein
MPPKKSRPPVPTDSITPRSAPKKFPKHHEDKHHDKKHDKKHHDKEHHAAKDLRRAFEHLGRVSVLSSHLSSAAASQAATLTTLAQQNLFAGQDKSAADLLRACEHLAFGSLASSRKATKLNPELEAAVRAEYEHLLIKATEHAHKHADSRAPDVEILYDAMLAAAALAYAKSAYHRAMEFARAAEALAHVRGDHTPMLEDGDEPPRKKLKA